MIDHNHHNTTTLTFMAYTHIYIVDAWVKLQIFFVHSIYAPDLGYFCIIY